MVTDLEVIGSGWEHTLKSVLLSDIDVLKIPNGEKFEQKILKLEYIISNCELQATLEIMELDNAYALYANGHMIAVAMKNEHSK